MVQICEICGNKLDYDAMYGPYFNKGLCGSCFNKLKPVLRNMKCLNEIKENLLDEIKCSCGNNTFRVYVTVIIDDARLYCSQCGKER